MKKLYKSEFDQILTGVIGGLGEYFDVDPTVLRVAFVVLVLVTGIFPGIVAYIIAYFIIPEKPHEVSTMVTPPPMERPEEPKPSTSMDKDSAPATPEPTTETKQEEPTSTI